MSAINIISGKFSMFQRIKVVLDPLSGIRPLIKNHFLLHQLIVRNVAMRYRGSLLGLFWSFVQPLMMLCVYTFVFGCVFKARWGVENETNSAFAVIMFCGVVFYTLFSESILSNCSVILANPNYVKKVIFPLELLPFAQVCSTFLVGLVWILLLFLGVVFIYGNLSWNMLFMPLLLLPLFLLTCGISYFVASLSVYIRDTPYVVGVLLQIMFFMTPIFYRVEAVPERYRLPLQLNPMTLIIDEARKVFIYGAPLNWYLWAISMIVSLAAYHLGFAWFYKTKRGFADVL